MRPTESGRRLLTSPRAGAEEFGGPRPGRKISSARRRHCRPYRCAQVAGADQPRCPGFAGGRCGVAGAHVSRDGRRVRDDQRRRQLVPLFVTGTPKPPDDRAVAYPTGTARTLPPRRPAARPNRARDARTSMGQPTPGSSVRPRRSRYTFAGGWGPQPGVTVAAECV